MLVSSAIDLCERYKLPWHAILDDSTKKYIRMVVVTKEGEYHLPLVPTIEYMDWHNNISISNSKVDGFVLSYVLSKLKY